MLLPKTESQATTPLSFRPLGVASSLYRLYARIRAQQLTAHFECHTQLPPSVHGFRKGRSAQIGAQLVALTWRRSSKSQTAAKVLCQLDLSKFFDTIPWEPVEFLLRQLGIPVFVIRAIRNWWRNLKRRFQVGQTLSPPSSSCRGLPQGCPFSPILSAILLLPLLQKLEKLELQVTSYADDLSLVGTIAAFTLSLPCIADYLGAMGLQLNAGKTQWLCPADDPTTHQDLLQLLAGGRWGTLATAPVRVLGIATRAEKAEEYEWSTTQGQRESKLQARLRRAQRVTPPAVRTLAVEALVTATTYGCTGEFIGFGVTQWTTRLALNAITAGQNLRAAEEVVGTLLCKGHRAVPTWAAFFAVAEQWIRIINSAERDTVQQVWEEGQKDPAAAHPWIIQVSHLLQLLRWTWPTWNTWKDPQGEVHMLEVTSTPSEVWNEILVSGGQFDVHLIRTQFIQRALTLRGLWQHIGHLLRQEWRSFIFQALSLRRRDFTGLPPLDWKEHRAYLDTLQPLERKVCATLFTGGSCTAVRRQRLNVAGICPWCQTQDEDEEHRFWTCPRHQGIRVGYPLVMAAYRNKQFARYTLCTGLTDPGLATILREQVRSMMLAIAVRCHLEDPTEVAPPPGGAAPKHGGSFKRPGQAEQVDSDKSTQPLLKRRRKQIQYADCPMPGKRIRQEHQQTTTVRRKRQRCTESAEGPLGSVFHDLPKPLLECQA